MAWTCRFCGEAGNYEEFCKTCGEELVPIDIEEEEEEVDIDDDDDDDDGDGIICSECGTWNRPIDDACTTCGAVLTDDD